MAYDCQGDMQVEHDRTERTYGAQRKAIGNREWMVDTVLESGLNGVREETCVMNGIGVWWVILLLQKHVIEADQTYKERIVLCVISNHQRWGNRWHGQKYAHKNLQKRIPLSKHPP